MARKLRPLKERLMEKVVIARSGCWVYSGFRIPKGYSYIGLSGRGKKVLVHRAAWLVFRGEIPSRKWVLHRCDNPPCVNPDHLFLGTAKDNNNDMRSKNRDCHGAASPNAKIDASTVLLIRRLVSSGARQNKLAALFGLSQAQVCRIVSEKRWARLA